LDDLAVLGRTLSDEEEKQLDELAKGVASLR
jgi:hypothetical protein